jgi:ABC-type maltose transport system permease subunit
VEAGSNTLIAVGTPGVIFLMNFCGECRSCKLGLTNQCLHKRDDMGFSQDGGYGPYLPKKFQFENFVTVYKEAHILNAEIDESAILDGCGPLTLFLKIVVPLLKPVTMTIIIIQFLGIVWNDFGNSIYFLNTESKYSLVMTTFYFFKTNTNDWNLVFADLVFVTVPVVIVYLFLQKHVISGMTAAQ